MGSQQRRLPAHARSHWSCGDESFYEGGISIVELLLANSFELSVQVFYNGELAEIIPSTGILSFDEADRIKPGTLRFDGMEAVFL